MYDLTESTLVHGTELRIIDTKGHSFTKDECVVFESMSYGGYLAISKASGIFQVLTRDQFSVIVND